MNIAAPCKGIVFEEALGRHVALRIETGRAKLRDLIGRTVRGKVLAVSPVGTRVQPPRIFIDPDAGPDALISNVILVVQLSASYRPSPDAESQPIPVEVTLWDKPRRGKLGDATGLLTFTD